jgi:hypothetical protein
LAIVDGSAKGETGIKKVWYGIHLFSVDLMGRDFFYLSLSHSKFGWHLQGAGVRLRLDHWSLTKLDPTPQRTAGAAQQSLHRVPNAAGHLGTAQVTLDQVTLDQVTLDQVTLDQVTLDH